MWKYFNKIFYVPSNIENSKDWDILMPEPRTNDQAMRSLVWNAHQFRVTRNRGRIVGIARTTSARGGKGRVNGPCTRQNRTTVNGSSLQSSYFLMMAGRATYVCTYTGDKENRVPAGESRQTEPQNRSVPYCSTSVLGLSSVPRHGPLLLDRLRPQNA